MLRNIFLMPMIIAVTALVTSCAPMPEADDEGHATFAREAIKALLGRPPRGADEVEVVADIAQLLGRDVAAKMLMKDVQFVDTWADVLAELLQVQREAGSGLAAQDQSCWGAPTRANPDPAIAQWVRDHGPTAGGASMPQNWNMTDLLRSAIAIDDLSPVYRAYLFTLSMRHAGGENRAEQSSRFLRTYLNRDVACLRCHNPTYSASNKTDGGGNIVWRRTWAIPGHAEKALFGNYYDAGAVLDRLRPIMRGDVRRPAAEPLGTRPWGIAESCARDTDTGNPANNGTLTHHGFRTLGAGTPNNPGAGFGSLDGSVNGKVSLWELEAALRAGIDDLKDGYERFTASNPILPPDEQKYCDTVEVFSAACTACHSGGAPPAGLNLSTNDPADELINVDTMSGASVHPKRVVAGNTGMSELWRRVDLNSMPPGGPLSAGDKSTIQTWIADGAPHTPNTSTCNTSPIPDVHPDEAFAFLTAANLVDGIWMAAMGYRLTIDNGFPRNSQQMHMLWNLTEYELLPKNWSLKAVLSKIVTSPWFARRAPSISQDDTAYALPPILDPWIVADPTEVSNPPAHQQKNGQGEMVDRFRVNALLRNVAASLAWKEPRRFPGGGYPSPLDQDLGMALSPQTPGFRGINFQSMLALESQIGLCNKTGRAVGATDWLDKAVDDIGTFNTANPGAPITMGEAWSMLKDRLIQDPSINRVLPSGLAGPPAGKTEEQAVVAFLNAGLNVPGGINLGTPTSAVSANQLRDKLREGCGIIAKSPQFTLTNVTPRSYSDNNMPGPPRLNVCMPGEPCGYTQACGHWRQRLGTMGHSIACQDRTVRKSIWFILEVPLDLVAVLDPIPPWKIWPIVSRQWVADPYVQIPSRKPELDLIKSVRVMGTADRLKGANRLHQRVATLCPGGMCGFVERASSEVARCVENPKGNACRAMHPPCDPRNDRGFNACGKLPADVGDSGVLVMWAEGAEVQEAGNVRVLGQDGWRWEPLRVGSKLQAGDLIHLPLRASLRLRMEGVSLGDTRMEEADVEGVKGHLLAVTGPSAEKLLARQPRRGALSADQLLKGVQAGAFDTRAMTRQDLRRAIRYGVPPEHRPTPTVKEIMERNADFEALHQGFERERRN
jgi:hypothetical protein